MTDHLTYRLGLSTVSQIIRDVCEALWVEWKDDCFPELTEELSTETAKGFEDRAQFPHCVAAIDGKHIRIIKLSDTGSHYYNYKQFFSILLLAMCDSNYLFLYIDVGSYGKSSDSTVFKNSALHKKLLNEEIKLPPARPLPGQTEHTPFMIVGDKGLVCRLSFYARTEVIFYQSKRGFYYRASGSRRYIECSFGICANKWRIFHRPINVEIELAENLIRAACLLHNFVRKRDGYRFDDTLTVQGFDEMPSNPTPAGRGANAIWDRFADFFVSEEGKVPWQDQKI